MQPIMNQASGRTFNIKRADLVFYDWFANFQNTNLRISKIKITHRKGLSCRGWNAFRERTQDYPDLLRGPDGPNGRALLRKAKSAARPYFLHSYSAFMSKLTTIIEMHSNKRGRIIQTCFAVWMDLMGGFTRKSPDAPHLCFFMSFHSFKPPVWFWKDIKKPEITLGLFLVAGAGLEPTTFGLWAQRATNCSTPQYVLIVDLVFNEIAWSVK